MTRPLPAISAGLLLVGLMTACDDRPVDRAPPPEAADGIQTAPTASIIRPSVRAEVEKPAEPAPQPAEARVLFDYGSAALSDVARVNLDGFLATQGLIDNRWTLTLTGHTDSRGGTQANQRMARERAEAVRDYLVAGGVTVGQITIVAAGEAGPVPDQTAEDAAAARRVDVLATPPPRT